MNMNLKTLRRSLVIAAFAGVTALTASDADPFLGRWALTIPGGGAGWLGVTKENGYYDASILWGGGSVVPVSSVFFTENQLWVMRVREVKRKDAAGKVARTHQFTEAICDAAANRVVGYGLEAGVQMAPVISHQSRQACRGVDPARRR